MSFNDDITTEDVKDEGRDNADYLKPSWIKRHGVTLLIVGVMILGLGIMLYPKIADFWNNMHQSQAIMNYVNAVSDLDEEDYEEMMTAARKYNKKLAKTGILWRLTDEQKKEYNSLLNVDGTGIMGYISIPKIDIELPVYHGTDEAVLQTSIGHLEGTSLPVGGSSTHSVLSGHRGLPSARLFSDIDQLMEDDIFMVTILNETFTYQVDQINVVLPEDLSKLSISKGMDYCTLLTCTPYGINTHRLLVRGHRIPNINGDANVITEAIQIRPVYIVPFVLAPVILFIIVYLIVRNRRRKKTADAAGTYMASMGLV